MILIVGGAGYIGSHVNKVLSGQGYETVVFDNLVYGHREAVKWGRFVQGDLEDAGALAEVFAQYPIDAVMHFSAYAYVGESVNDPAKYYRNNVARTLNLLDAMLKHNIKNFIFSSTCATYGEVETIPITEDLPQRPVNPYGRTKLMVEQILADYRAAYGMNYSVLRYFNAAGADPDGEIGEWHEPETHLIPLVLDAAIGKRVGVSVFGRDYPTADGTCVRDYIHVNDLADAHIKALEYIKCHNTADCFNLGNGQGYSVLEIIDTARRITGRSINVSYGDRRPGDPPVLVGSSQKARRLLGWQPRFDLSQIIATAWQWHQKHNAASSN